MLNSYKYSAAIQSFCALNRYDYCSKQELGKFLFKVCAKQNCFDPTAESSSKVQIPYVHGQMVPQPGANN